MWKTVKLSSVLSLQNGYAFKSDEYTESGYFVMRITNVQQGYISAHNPKYIQIKETSTLVKFILQEGDLLVSLTGDVGRVGVINKEHLPAVLNQRVARIIRISSEKLDKRFLFLFLNSEVFRKQVEERSYGAAQANVSTKSILEIEIPLPPLAEQQRIVEKLDRAFAEIDVALKTIEKKMSKLDETIEQSITRIESEYDGCTKKVGSIADLLSGNAFKSSEYSVAVDDIALLRGDNLNPSHIDLRAAKRIAKSRLNEFSKFLLTDGDIVLGMDRPVVSSGLRIAQVKDEHLPALLVQRVMRLRCANEIDADFLFLILNSSRFIRHLVGEQTGLSVPHISGKTIASFEVSVPNLKTQKKITDKFKNIFDSKLAFDLASKRILTELNFLRQAILKQALQPPQQ